MMRFGLSMVLGLALSVAQSQAADVEMSFITTSFADPTAEAFLVGGGRLWHKRALVHGAVLVRHGEQLFLYDAGLGTNIDAQFSAFDWLDRKIFAHSEVNPVIAQLAAQGLSEADIDFIVPSHLHWDHASGLPDFPNTPIWVQPAELAHARQGGRPSFMPETLAEALHWHSIQLNDEPFLGFEQSLDLFGDGKVVLVGLPGHTAGQVGLYLDVGDTQRYLFVGDASWTVKGIAENRDRSWLLTRLVKLNHSDDQMLATLKALHDLSIADPELIIVPMHDEGLVATLPAFPKGMTWN